MRLKFVKRKKIDSKKLLNLYGSVGWVTKKDKADNGRKLSKVYQNSQIVISVWDKDLLVGVIRVLTDKTWDGVIFGLAIRPQYQNKGIGTVLIEKCVKQYPGVKWYFGAANPRLNKFYKKVGFKKEKDNWFYREKT